MNVRLDGDVARVRFVRSERWRDPKLPTTVFDSASEAHVLGRDRDCRVVALDAGPLVEESP